MWSLNLMLLFFYVSGQGGNTQSAAIYQGMVASGVSCYSYVPALADPQHPAPLMPPPCYDLSNTNGIPARNVRRAR